MRKRNPEGPPADEKPGKKQNFKTIFDGMTFDEAKAKFKTMIEDDLDTLRPIHVSIVSRLDPDGEDIWNRFTEQSREVQKDCNGFCTNAVTFAMEPGEFCGRVKCGRKHTADERWSEEDRREFLLEVLGA